MTDAGIQITVEGTPNPNAAKFVLDRDIPGEGSRSYFDPESAAEDCLGRIPVVEDEVRRLAAIEERANLRKRPHLSLKTGPSFRPHMSLVKTFTLTP